MNFVKVISFSLLVGFAGGCSPSLEDPDANFTDVKFTVPDGMKHLTVKHVFVVSKKKSQSVGVFDQKLLGQALNLELCFGSSGGETSETIKPVIWAEAASEQPERTSCNKALQKQRTVLPLEIAKSSFMQSGIELSPGVQLNQYYYLKYTQQTDEGTITNKVAATVFNGDLPFLGKVCSDNNVFPGIEECNLVVDSAGGLSIEAGEKLQPKE